MPRQPVAAPRAHRLGEKALRGWVSVPYASQPSGGSASLTEGSSGYLSGDMRIKK